MRGHRLWCILALLLLVALPLAGRPEVWAERLAGVGGEDNLFAGSGAVQGTTVPFRGSADPSWVIERVDLGRSFQNMGSRSLALDHADRPHLAYGSKRLYYAWHDGTTWHTEVVDEASTAGEYTSLVLDENDRPRISYRENWPPGAQGVLKYAYYSGSNWQVAAVDSTGDVGAWTSLALDAAGRPHISYYDLANRDLKYARFDGTAWQIHVVDSAGEVGEYTSLALDAAGLPYISYFDRTQHALKYAHYNGTSWGITILDGYYAGAFTSLALDSAGRLHIGYADMGPYANRAELRYAYYDGHAWQFEVVDTGDLVDCFTFVSLDLDAADHPHISYCACGGSIKYAHRVDSSWVVTAVAPARWSAEPTSLALDSAGNPRIGYGFYDLRLASWTGTTWDIETVDYYRQVGLYASLDVSADGSSHIGYYVDRGQVRYARRDGLGWQVQMAADGLYHGWATSLALDSTGDPRMSYVVDEGAGLVYAYLSGTVWLTQTVEGWVEGGYLGYDSLALDAAGRPCISYGLWNEQSDWTLRYARYDGIAWLTETVDAEPGAGLYTSLALDAVDRPHIAYWDRGHGDLRYARNDGAGWITETVEGAGNVGGCPSLALSAAGQPHVSYYDGTNGSLRYAYNEGGVWITETVDPEGGCSSLALDGAGRPHIAYADHSDYTSEVVLKYAYYDESGWHIFPVDTTINTMYLSLQLDPAGRPHIAYSDELYGDLKYAYICTPAAKVALSGPPILLAGSSGLYTATVSPPTATLPLVAWDNGAIGPTAAYSWTQPGTYTITVTATNGCSAVSATLVVAVVCQEVAEVTVAGPAGLRVGETGVYTASFAPPTATLPVTLTWGNGSITESVAFGDTAYDFSEAEIAGTVGPTAIYSWALPGTYTVSVTATNPCGQARGAWVVVVSALTYRFYLPLVVR